MNSDFEKRLKEAQGKRQPNEQEVRQKSEKENKEKGVQAGAELIAGVVFGVFLGYTADNYFSTKPLFLILGFFLGVCAGFYNIYRITNDLGTSVGLSRLPNEEKDDTTTLIKKDD